MDLFCINDKGWCRVRPFNKRHSIIESVSGPKYGDTVTVTGDERFGGKLYYYLEQWPDLGPYDSVGFIPLQDKTEETVAEEELEAMEVL